MWALSLVSVNLAVRDENFDADGWVDDTWCSTSSKVITGPSAKGAASWRQALYLPLLDPRPVRTDRRHGQCEAVEPRSGGRKNKTK
jgi:hypothetical protein